MSLCLSNLSVYVCMCCAYASVCKLCGYTHVESMWKSQVDIRFPQSFSFSRSGKNSKLNPMLTFLLWGSPDCIFQSYNYRPDIQSTQPLCGFRGSELWSSYLSGKHSTNWTVSQVWSLPPSRPLEFLILPSGHFNSSCTPHCLSVTSLVI